MSMETSTKYDYLDDVPVADWWWFGGLFIGEGCFIVQGRINSPSPGLSVAVSDEAVCKRLYKLFGGKFFEATRTDRSKHIEPEYVWKVNTVDHVWEILRRMRPYIVGYKAEQCEAMITFTRRKRQMHAQKTTRSYSTAEKLELLTLAYAARQYAQGGRKEWKVKWTTQMALWVKELNNAEAG